MKSTAKLRDDQAPLDANELHLLKKLIHGYGWLNDTARKVGVHVNTVRNVIKNGYGKPATIYKIRRVLDRENSPYQPEKN